MALEEWYSKVYFWYITSNLSLLQLANHSQLSSFLPTKPNCSKWRLKYVTTISIYRSL